MSTKEITQRLGLSNRTVQRWLAAGTFPEAKRRRKRRSAFDAFAPEVLKCWQAGERNGLALWRAIKAQGYTGSAGTVYRYLEPLKQAEVRASSNPQRLQQFSAKTAVWLFVRDPPTLDEVEQEDLAAWCQVSPTRHASVSAGARVSGHGPSARRAALRCLVITGGKQCASRTPVLCLWGGARQGGGASGLNLSPQQCPDRGAGDQSQTRSRGKCTGGQDLRGSRQRVLHAG